MNLKAVVGGFAGACTLTLINEGFALVDKKAPRLDLLGMNAVAKLVKNPASTPLLKNLLPVSLVGDLVSNSLYYGLASGASRERTLIRGALLGLGAGIGAVTLPKPMGLDERPTNATTRTKAMTVLYYLVGGLIAAAAINALDDKKG
ncbi:MAG TPA: hypothetical protein VKZ68_02210 [Ohtaekwangia sp.]|nr:hypothetical protein [Ohtaekwangia sp.]